jgi:hypothetical protein
MAFVKRRAAQRWLVQSAHEMPPEYQRVIIADLHIKRVINAQQSNNSLADEPKS